MKKVVLLILCLLAMPAWAQQQEVTKEELTQALHGVANQADQVLTPEDQAAMLCNTTKMMKGVPGAAYQSGVDAHGNPVVPADGGAEQIFQVPDRIDIPLDVEILRQAGVVQTPTPELSTNLGMISVLKGGKILFNGKDISNKFQDYCNTNSGN